MRMRFATRIATFLLTALMTAAHCSQGQANSITSVTKLYAESFGTTQQADLLRQSLLAHIRKSGEYQIVDVANDADAILKGSGQIWVKGYFTVNSRAPAVNRHPVYAGYLSVEISSRNGEPLWSFLVTPSRFSWTNIVDDLAGNMSDEMLKARKTAMPSASGSAATQSSTHADLVGAGATFPAPLYRLWFQSFQGDHPGIHLNYSAVGSESGVQMLLEKKADFAASDVSPQEMSTAELRSVKAHRFATVLGGVVPIYHLDGLTKDLSFTAKALADIYLGKVTRWNDPEIRSSNKGIDLPDAPIIVIHRSDGSGTTRAWSEFLSGTDDEWKSKVGTGTKLNWPVGQGTEGSEGVASAVEKTPNAIGYVEFVYAIQHQLGFGAVQNSSGRFVRASLNSLAEAARTLATESSSGSYASITNSSDKEAYPIASLTWLLIPEQIADPQKKQALVELIRWELTAGQKESSALGYAPLPAEMTSQQLDLLHRIE